MSTPYWIHNWSPFLFQFSDTVGVRYYGLAYVLGFLGAAWLLVRYARAGRSRLPEGLVGDFMVSLVIGVLLGGRLGYFIFYQFESVLANPLVLARVWEGGMSFHGGLLGVLIALLWFSWRRKLPLAHISDLVATATPLGLMLGRVANFINGELWGRVTTVPWAVIFPNSDTSGLPLPMIAPRHPSQLYEALLEGLVLLIYVQWRFWRTDAIVRSPGRIAGECLFGYAIARIICEQFREPDAALILGMSRGTFYSILVLVAGGIVMLRRRSVAP